MTARGEGQVRAAPTGNTRANLCELRFGVEDPLQSSMHFTFENYRCIVRRKDANTVVAIPTGPSTLEPRTYIQLMVSEPSLRVGSLCHSNPGWARLRHSLQLQGPQMQCFTSNP